MLLRIQIISTGQYLVLNSDGALPVEVNSTLFNNQDELLGSFTYSGTCALEPNRAKIKNAQNILSDPKLRKFAVRAWLNAGIWLSGTFAFIIEGTQINFNIYFDTSSLANQFKALKLNQLSDPNINDQLHFDTVDEYKAFLKATTTAEPGTYPMVYFPYRNDGAYNIVDPASYGDYPDISFPVNTLFNAWKVEEDGTGNFLVDANFPVKQTQTPFFYLSYVLKRIALFFGCKPAGRWLDEETTRRITIATMVTFSSWNIIADYWLYMPDVAVNEFLKAIRTEFGLLILPNLEQKVMYFESLSNLDTQAPIADLRDCQLATGYRETGASADCYTITQAPDDKDAAFNDTDKQNLPVLTIGDLSAAIQTTTITMISATTKMVTENAGSVFPGLSNWRIPYLKQPIAGSVPFTAISSVSYSDTWTFKIRLLYYHGMVKDDSELYTYPYGSADNLDKDNRKIAPFSLALNAASGVFVAVRRYYQFMQTSKPFEMDFLLTVKQLLGISPLTRILVRDFNLAPVYCLLAQLAVDATVKDADKLSAKLTLWPSIRLDNAAEILPGDDTGGIEPPPDNGTVYARLELRNIVDVDIDHPTPENGQRGDLYVTFWLDAGATTPKDVTGLPLRYSVTETVDGDTGGATTAVLSLSATSPAGTYELLLESDRPVNLTIGPEGDSHLHSWTYAALVSAYYTPLDTIIIT